MKLAALQIATFAGYAALGPITGPLVAGLVRSVRAGEVALAGLYGLAIPVTYAGLVSLAAVLLPMAAAASS